MSLELRIERQLGTFGLDVALDIAAGELVALYGHSGSGKSMTLRSVAGLERPDAGRIVLQGRTLYDSVTGVSVPPHERRIGLVVQHYALFPHLTAAENIAYGLRGSLAERARRVAELASVFHLEGLEARKPHQLSGGQQQRVALARALARPVEALLLDEPFSALDEALRADLRAELLRLRRELDVPVIFVTHDLREAHLLADRIAVLDGGRVLQFAPRGEVFRHPASRRVAELTGVPNIFEGRGLGGSRVEIGGMPFEVATPVAAGAPLDVCIRAERCLLRRIEPGRIEPGRIEPGRIEPGETLPANCFVADITRELAFGSTYTLRMDAVGAGPSVEVEVSSHPYEVLGVASRRRWVVELPPAELHVMARGAG